MRFTEYFKIGQGSDDDWYDPHLTVDTPLFIDPYQILKASGVWEGAHEELIDHFVHCYYLVKQNSNIFSESQLRATTLLTFPEASELCLGYTASGTKGTGGGKGYASIIVDTMKRLQAVESGPGDSVEEYSILTEGFGADRVSDATVNILKHRFIAYTQKVCHSLGIEMEIQEVRNAAVDLASGKWLAKDVLLPRNPFSGNPILLVPKQFLVERQALDWNTWKRDESFRKSINQEVTKKIRKKVVSEAAFRDTEALRGWITRLREEGTIRPYDFTTDPAGFTMFDKLPDFYIRDHPLSIKHIFTTADLVTLVDEIRNVFVEFIEGENGWTWFSAGNATRKREAFAQLLTLTFFKQYFEEYKIEIDQEQAFGKQQIRLTSESGLSIQILVLVKRLSNRYSESKLRENLLNSSPEYTYFIIIKDEDTKTSSADIKSLKQNVAQWKNEYGIEIGLSILDILP